eukprot:scaffold122811_cov36-Tisochrysis_lutea.AAC.2
MRSAAMPAFCDGAVHSTCPLDGGPQSPDGRFSALSALRAGYKYRPRLVEAERAATYDDEFCGSIPAQRHASCAAAGWKL